MRLSLFCTDRSGWVAVALFLAIFTVTARAAVEPSRYEARVTAPRAQIRSGPGEKFYPTHTLSQGEVVEVYREQADGWLAIRPPQHSFSLVHGRQLKLQDGGLAELSDDNVASRIGSGLSDKRNAVQVRLKKGEVVEILGEQRIEGEKWYKIAPPAGEFRWIHATSVERLGALSTSVKETSTEPPAVSASNTKEPAVDGDKESSAETAAAVPAPSNAPATDATPGEQWRPSAAGSSATPAHITPRPLASIASNPAPLPSNTSPDQNAVAVRPAEIDLSRELTDIELRLSRMAAAPPNLWNTERLARDAEQLLAQAQTPAERDAVKVTLSKIDQFATLGRRYQQGAPNVAMSGQSITPLAGAAGGSPTEAGRYDAVGILRPVVSKRPGAPQFALVDERGQVLSFVTPSPDMNLQPYLGHRVGIAGNRGFIPEFNRAHVTAGRVTPLSERMVR